MSRHIRVIQFMVEAYSLSKSVLCIVKVSGWSTVSTEVWRKRRHATLSRSLPTVHSPGRGAETEPPNPGDALRPNAVAEAQRRAWLSGA
jgi:hypothetical protein